MTINIGASEQSTYPVAAVREGIVFPNTENVLVFGRAKSIEAINEAYKRDKMIVLVSQKNQMTEDPSPDALYDYGVLATIEKTSVGEKGEITALVKGQVKVRFTEYTQESPYLEARVELLPEETIDDEEIQAMVRHISNQIKKSINLGKTIDFVFLMNILNITNARDFSYQIAMVLDLKGQERQDLLEDDDLKSRLKKEVNYVNREVKILEIEHNISSKTQQKFEQGMKETFLREKMKTIEEELGGKEEGDVKEYRRKIRDAHMPKDIEEKAIKELKRLAQMSQFNPESSYIRTYLDWLVELPWSVKSDSQIELQKAEEILNDDHYGLKKVKERILEYLAVIQLKRKMDEQREKGQKKNDKTEKPPSILCFVGPPGVGKTSLGRSIARALDRKFVKISLGGIRDEAEIRGHRRTYVGALPGRMIQAIKQAGTSNPVFMLDEIDKIGRDYRGDPSSALLEALDPEQNHSFSDHYLEVPFDLSDVFFITTANILDTIPEALMDRLEIIPFAGYTEEEKFNIAKNYLTEKQINAHSLDVNRVKVTDDALRMIISRYTREAGVRELERQIATIMRKVAREFVEKGLEKKVITNTHLHKYLGPYKYSSQMIEEKDAVGISTGLFVTPVGGGILFIEVSVMPGKGNLIITGQLGDVMKESCQAALSYVRSRWEMFGLNREFFNKIDVHVHVPEGATPKDGPSAGIAITTAMISALTKIPVRRDVAMTGEITLRGRVLEIGGVKEKTLAAHRAGIKKVLLPKDNGKDLEDVKSTIKKEMEFITVEHMDDVLEHALLFPKNKTKFPLRTKEVVRVPATGGMN